LTKEKTEKILKETLFKLYGLKGVLEASPTLIYFDPSRQGGIISCTHNTVTYVRAALSWAPPIASLQNTMFYTVKVTGTIKKAKKILSSLQQVVTLNKV